MERVQNQSRQRSDHHDKAPITRNQRLSHQDFGRILLRAKAQHGLPEEKRRLVENWLLEISVGSVD